MQDIWNSNNVKKTIVMVVSKTRSVQCCITLDNSTLDQMTRYCYLGSWITEDAICEVDIKTRIAMTNAAFWQNKELMREKT